MFKNKILYKFYEWNIMRKLDHEYIPKHVAIIMDGNRRYSRAKNEYVLKGHERGAEILEKVLDWSIELGIDVVTAYAFSVENFNRNPEEVEGLMKLFEHHFKRLVTNERIHKNEVKITAMGRLELLPDFVLDAIREAEESTADYSKRFFNIAIGYDGRLEIVDAIKKISQKVKNDELSVDDISEDLVAKNLYTRGLIDPNLIIRTSGEERLSGFLLWQSSYSELYFCDNLWPELRKVDFLRAIRDYQKRDRRFGV